MARLRGYIYFVLTIRLPDEMSSKRMVPITEWHSAIGQLSTIQLPDVSDNRMPTVVADQIYQRGLSRYVVYKIRRLILKV